MKRSPYFGIFATFIGLVITLIACGKHPSTPSDAAAPVTTIARIDSLPNALTDAEAERVLRGAAVTNIHFGTHYLLLALATNVTPAGLKLDLAWRSLTNQIRNSVVPIHIVDSGGKMLAQADYKFDTNQTAVNANTQWLDSVLIPYEKLVGANSIALGIINPDKTWEPAGSGHRDQDNRRLLVPIPAGLPRESAPLDGNFESATCDVISGWAWNKKEPNSPVKIELLIDHNAVTNISAGEYRKDLESAGIGDGKHGFRFATPPQIKDGTRHILSVQIEGMSYVLKSSPKTLNCSGQ